MSRDRRTFDALYQRHANAVLAYCARRVPAADAQDLAADVFAVAWRRRDDIPDEPLPWLYGVARRTLSHHWRAKGRAERLVDKAKGQHPIANDGPEAVVERNDEHALVRQAVASLRPVDRDVLTLAAWEGLDHRQIAQVLDCSVAAIDKRMVRARQRLADTFESLSSDPAAAPSASDAHFAPARARKGGGSQ